VHEPNQGLYWLNMLSAVLDNATLAAAEIDPSMTILQIKSALLGLLIAGGTLGNIPNIIYAGKLRINSSEWARFSMPLGLLVMTGYFLLLMFIK
jgi:predicted cation transporter